ncbi:hypothetical protein PaeCFBP13512_23065, partial [Paenibacillus sp. CFBP13512]|uniref:hypothetical protein n=1 Tax=Paenibacillus sp. CFBP13512 TaxID=2184007 RepID=UPI00113F5708
GELKIIKPKKNNSKYIFIKDNIFSMCMSNSKDYNQIKTWSSEFQICDRKEEYTNNYYCKKNGTLATLKAIFSPEVPLDLAVLCGCKVEELPDLLQVWSAHEETSSHNSILDRIDPMDWLPKNPWIKLNLNIVIHLSKRGYTQICKSHNAKPHRFWKEDNV